jgi:TolB protein
MRAGHGQVLLAQGQTLSLTPSGEFFYQDVAWSPDGRRIAFSEYGERDGTKTWRVWVARADGTEQRVLADSCCWVSWSPDGRSLLVTSQREGQAGICSLDSAGTALQRLTQGESGDRHPAYSPDGLQIAFTSERAGKRAVYVMAADGSNVRRVSYGAGEDHNPQWSPDGGRVVFARSGDGGGHDQIHVATVDGLAEYAITNDSLLNMYPSFISVREVAFCRRTGDSAAIVVADVTGQGHRRVGDVAPYSARWSPDGSRIAFIAGRWPVSAIYVMRSDGTAVHKVMN